MSLPISGIRPSWKSGFARSAGESANPSLWKGLVGAWVPALGVTGGTLRDVSGRHAHGALTNMPISTAWGVGQYGHSLDFNTNDYVNCGDLDTLDGFSSMTVILRIRFDTVAGTQNLITKYIGVGDQRSYILIMTSSGKLRWVYDSDGTVPGFGDWITSAIAINVGVWTHIALIHGNGTVRIFAQNIERASAKSSGAAPTVIHAGTAPLHIGSDVGASPFDGQLADVRIYNRALTANEIFFDYANPLAPFRLKPLTIATGGAAPAGGFQSAWASGSNRIIQ